MRRLSLPLTLSILIVGIAIPLAVVVALALSHGSAARAQGTAPSPCTVATQMGASPAIVPLGYSTRVTMSLRADCPVTATAPLHVVLVLDGSGSMSGDRTNLMKAAARQFVADLDLPGHPLRRVGVVQYSNRALTLCQLTNDPGRVTSCLGRFTSAGAAAMDAGIDEALRVLIRGRPRDGTEVRQVMILLAAGANGGGCPPVLSAANRAKSQQVLLITIALGPGADRDCLRQAASSSRYFHDAAQPQELAAVFTALAALINRIDAGGLVTVLVRNALPPNMRYIADTAVPEPATSSPALLEWWIQLAAGTSPAAISLWVTPLELGEHPVSSGAEGFLRDSMNQERPFAFPIPKVRVVDGTGLPTPTSFPTRTPTNPPPPTATLVPTPITPTPAPPTPRQCPGLDRLVPRQAIDDALANPHRVAGWDQLCNPGLPPGPFNAPRTTLSLSAPSKPYHPLFNGVEFRCGCP